MQTANTLINTKLHPPFTRTTLVHRQRLESRIAEGLRVPLTLITAPAGFGKTTLLTACISHCDVPLAWLSLDKQDNQPGRFLKYVLAAIHSQDERIAKEAMHMLASMQSAPQAVLTSLINSLDATGKEIALVLDDYQLINNQDIHALVTFLLEHCPQNFHLVIATRSDPPLPLARLRARGQMVELRAADLRFTEPEISEFLNDIMALQLDAGSLAVLGDRTEGWIAGLQMAALSLRGRDAAHVENLIRGFAGTHRFIMDYLLEEVLSREPEHVRSFLYSTAILNRLNGPLCDAVTGMPNGQQMLEDLERRNLFVLALDNERTWYRYHHLFADMLLSHLNQDEPDRINALNARAAAWCEDNGMIVDAVGYALASRDTERAARLVESHWANAIHQGEIETLWSWLNALPEDTISHSAVLGVAFCWVLWFRGEVSKIETYLTNAEQALHAQIASNLHDVPDTDVTQLPAEIAALHAFVARYNNAFDDAIAHAKRALTLVPDNLSPQDDAQLRSPIYLALATSCDGAGDLEQAVDAYQQTILWSQLGNNVSGVSGITYRLAVVLRLLGRLRAAEVACMDALAYLQAQNMDRLPVAGILHVALSEVLVERNDLEAAEKHINQALDTGKWGGRLDAVRNAAEALSRLRMARNDPEGALEAIQEAESTLGNPPSPLAWAELLALRTNILVRQGAVGEAARSLGQAQSLAGWDRGLTGEIIALAASRYLLAQGEPDEVKARLSAVIENAEAQGRSGAVIQYRILRSLALTRHTESQAAITELESALVLAEPEGYVRVFLDEGQPMQALLAQWLAPAGNNPLRDFAANIHAHFGTDQNTSATPRKQVSPNERLIEPLSQRELEVLDLIALGHTNKEIGQQLFVAPGTVKAHTASIYRKLDVANRTEAVARARELGILA